MTTDERQLIEVQEFVRAGGTVVANLRVDSELIKWAKSEDRFVLIDRRSKWGNPFRMNGEEDRAVVCERYAQEYLPTRLDLLAAIPELSGRVLGCWCRPAKCHGDRLAELANGGPND